MKKLNFILIFILVLAAFLRFYQLGQNPPSLTWDEAAWGYNAYSLGIDGKDEFGKFLPLDYLESFGDFKPPMYAYLDIIPVKLFGLNEFAVRFPSAFFGVLTVLLTYFLTKEIFDNRGKKLNNTQDNAEIIALISAFLLAISPWHINLSRAAFEANIATFFIILGVLLFLAGIREKKYFLIFSVISFIFSVYTFNTARIVSPLLFLSLTVAFRKQLFAKKKELLAAIIVGILFILPIINFLFSPQASLRFREVNIFSDSLVVENANQQILNNNNAWWSKIIHNRRFSYGVSYLKHYFDNLSPSFLFIKGDGNPKFSTQDVGQLYIWEIPFLIAGLLFLLRRKERAWWLLPLWIILGIIPAATARETPHALRIETILPTFQILTAFGIILFFLWLRSLKTKKIIINSILVFIFLSMIFNFLYYFHGYYSYYPIQFSGEWQYGYKESIKYVQTVKNNYDQINITDNLGRPYIYYLFYTETNPKEFQRTAKLTREVFGFVNASGFDKYIFANDLMRDDNKGKKILYINKADRVPGNARVLKKFFLLNKEPILAAYTL